MRPKKRSPRRFYSVCLLCAVCVGVLLCGYFLYQRSIADAVDGTTRSFMDQMADHDIRNVGSQVENRLNYIRALGGRLSLLREDQQSDIPYLLSVEAQATQFEKLYLVTASGTVYDSSFLISSLDAVPWADLYQAADGDFVVRYVIDKREAWGEYLLYGTRMEHPVTYRGEEIAGIVALVPVEELEGLIHLESFDGQGTTQVIEPGGEIITASRYYDNASDLNYFSELEQAEFLGDASLARCEEAIARGESLYIEYIFQGAQYNVMLKPMGEESYSNGWYMVVKVPESVAAQQTHRLLGRSLFFFALLSLVIFTMAAVVFKNMRAAQVAQASERAKSTFLANMSHEIRTPLNGITGLLYLMRQNLNDREKQAEYLEKAEVSAVFLKSVITEVLDMSKIESGQMELDSQKLDLGRLLREVEMLIGPQSEARGQHFSVDCDALPAPWVLGDEVRLKQIIVNLLGNALKFTPAEGAITLTVRQTLQGEIADTLFQISDTGCGMSPEFLEKIWLPFEQERRPGSQNGTGLGTTLSKLLVEKMGGAVTVRSRVGQGTTFTVRVPLPVAEQEAAPAQFGDERQVSLAGKQVLAVEDNDINREILTEILAAYGAVVTPAVNGQEAVDLFRQSAPFFFDVVLMDIQMPVLDGYGAARAIRALDRPDSAATPILALTANAFKQETDRARESGMDDVVTKPLDVDLLLQKLSGLGMRPSTADGEERQEETV